MLPGLTPNGRRVAMLRAADKDINTPNVADIMKLTLMIGDIRLLEEQVGVAGDVYIFDASVATPSHFAKFTPALVKKFLICVQVNISVERFWLFSFVYYRYIIRYFFLRVGSLSSETKRNSHHQRVSIGWYNH